MDEKIQSVVLDENKGLSEQLNCPNIKYIITTEIFLSKGELINIPENSILKFEGGSIEGNGTIIGNNTKIIAGLDKIFSQEVTLDGCWNTGTLYPEWFGAKGDGISDDTKAIRKTLSSAGFKTCVFQDKVYIINMERMSEPSRPTAIFDPVKVDNIIGVGNATLKLGKGNCDIPKGTGFVSILYISGKRHVKVENLTFDYNYDNNIYFQLGGKSVTVENNGQQCAILFTNAEKASVRRCTFKEASGNNVICMWFNNSSPLSEFVCENNLFVDFGKESHFRDEKGIVDAYHDVSVIGVHYNNGGNSIGRTKAIIRNNVARGVGGNALDFCECHADEVEFTDNIIENFAYCFMPLCARKDVSFLIKGNKFMNCIAAIHYWNMPEDGIPAEHNTYGYKDLVIDNNTFVLDFKKWFETPVYNTLLFKDSNGYYYAGAGYYGAISQAGKGQKHINSIKVTNNDIRYVNVREIPNSYFKNNYFATINIFSTPGQPENDNNINEFVISNNRLTNVPNIVFRNNGYNQINEFIFSGNLMYDVYSNSNNENRLLGGGLLSDIAFGGDSQTGTYRYLRKIKRAVITDNVLFVNKKNYTNVYATSCLGNILNDGVVKNSEVIIKNNMIIGEKYNQQVKVDNVERIINE